MMCFLPQLEAWKPITGYEGLYEVSSYGRVRSLDQLMLKSNGVIQKHTGRILSAFMTKGYKSVTLRNAKAESRKKNYLVSRLVGIAFVDGYEDGLLINHINGYKLDNHYTNLEWVTHKENTAHAIQMGLFKFDALHAHSESQSKSVVQLTYQLEMVKVYPSVSSTKIDGFHPSIVSKVCRKKNVTHAGYKWMFKEEYDNRL